MGVVCQSDLARSVRARPGASKWVGQDWFGWAGQVGAARRVRGEASQAGMDRGGQVCRAGLVRVDAKRYVKGARHGSAWPGA